jgi:hypothetical protein
MMALPGLHPGQVGLTQRGYGHIAVLPTWELAEQEERIMITSITAPSEQKSVAYGMSHLCFSSFEIKTKAFPPNLFIETQISKEQGFLFFLVILKDFFKNNFKPEICRCYIFSFIGTACFWGRCEKILAYFFH